MILNNDIMSKILEYSKLECKILYKIAYLDREHMSFIKEYYHNIFMKNILPTLDYMEYLNKYYTCSKCYKIDSNIYYDLDRPLCDNCMYFVDQCDYCGIYRDSDKLIDHPHRGLYCKDKCEYKCEKCYQYFDSIDDVVDMCDYHFICYACYVQENAIENYKRRKMNNL